MRRLGEAGTEWRFPRWGVVDVLDAEWLPEFAFWLRALASVVLAVESAGRREIHLLFIM